MSDLDNEATYLAERAAIAAYTRAVFGGSDGKNELAQLRKIQQRHADLLLDLGP